jgi:hypothetical protein
MSRRDHLYGDFIEGASRLFSDALTLEFDEPSKFVRLYALIERLRLFASAKVFQASGCLSKASAGERDALNAD